MNESSETNEFLCEPPTPTCMHTSHIKNFYFSPGSYIFIEASHRRYGDKARLISDWLEPNETMCLQFWYHMQGKDVGNLNVYIRAKSSQTQIWSQEGNQGNRWLFAQVPIYHIYPFKVGMCNFSLAVNLDWLCPSSSHTLHYHRPEATPST